MRIRTNYDDSDIFVYGQPDQDTAAAHYQNLLGLVRTFSKLTHNIIRRKVGADEFDALLALAR